jgi:WD40 repeat protein
MIAFSPDARLAAYAPTNSRVCVVEVSSGRELLQLESIDQRLIGGLSFSPDGQRLAVSCEGALVLLWDLRTGNNTTDVQATGSGTGTLLDITDQGSTGTVNIGSKAPNFGG